MLLQALSVPRYDLNWKVHFIIVVVNFRGLNLWFSPQLLLDFLNDLSDVDFCQPRFRKRGSYRDSFYEYAFRDSYFRDVSLCVLSLPNQLLSQVSNFDWCVYGGVGANFCGVFVCRRGDVYADCFDGDDGAYDCLRANQLRHGDYLSFGAITPPP